MTQVVRVTGPPGTGKTWYLAKQAKIASKKHGTHAVAICSLTNTAAKNIGARTSLPDNNVATLHSHCLRSLGSPALAESPDVIKQFSELHPGHRRTARAATGDPAGGGTSADRHHEQADAYRAAMIPEDRWSPAVLNYHRTWTAWKRTEGLLDFTDLIAESAQTGLQLGHQVLLVDEAQDLSRLELQVIRATSRRMSTTVLAGDGAQALFAFRGADPLALGQVPADIDVVLSTSWRCGQSIIDRARTLLRAQQPELDTDYSAKDGRVGQVRRSRASAHDPAATAHEIRQAVQHGTVMVVATCAHLLNPLCAELKRTGVPFHNPYRPDQPAWNPMRKAPPLRALTAMDAATWGADVRDWTWRDLQTWTDPLVNAALAPGARDLIAYRNTKDQFGVSSAGQVVPMDTIAGLLHGGLEHPVFQSTTAGMVDWWADNLRRPKSAVLPLKVWRNDPAALTREPQVIVGTAHSVKGGEADTTIVLPDASRSAWWLGDRGAIARTLYVALTRARHTLLLGAPGSVEAMQI